MRKKFSQIGSLAIAAVLAVFLFPFKVSAHPGNTASDGCHYCRTRCDYWGEVWDARHCHGGGSSTIIETIPAAPVVVPNPPPSPVIIYVYPSPVPSPKPSPKPSLTPMPTPSPSPLPSPTPTPSPQVLGEETDSESSGGGLVTAGLLGYVAWRAIKQKWPFHAE